MKIRNIWINVGLLQEKFATSAEQTLGENFNTLFRVLQSNTLGMITLQAENTDGTINFEDKAFTDENAEFITKSKDNGELYVFPVWHNDSMVISQNICIIKKILFNQDNLFH